MRVECDACVVEMGRQLRLVERRAGDAAGGGRRCDARPGRSALWVTIAAAARLVPYVVCSPAAGVLAGRHRFGVVCRTASVVRLAVQFVLTVLVVTRPQPVLLVATLFGLTAAGTPVYPGLVAATRAVMPVERLAAANAVTAAVESAAFVTGPGPGRVCCWRRSDPAL